MSGRATAQKPERLRAAFGGGEAASGEAGEKAWRFSAPAHPLLPAVRAVLGGKNGAFSARVRSGLALIFGKSQDRAVVAGTILALFILEGVNAIKTEEKRRHSVWLDDATWGKVQYHYKLDGCTTQNDFIDKAIQFYCSYLQSEYAGDFLPKILGETLEAILSMFGDRIGKLLLKQAVEQNVCNHILASDTDIDAQTYQQMRGKSYQEVLRTNGQISFPEVLRQKSRW